MIKNIKKAFIDNLPNLDWMDNETRTAATGKVSVKHNVFIVFFVTSFASLIIISWTAVFSIVQLRSAFNTLVNLSTGCI